LVALSSRPALGQKETHAHTALNSSNGSPQARQRCRALQAVVPKRLMSSVSAEPHLGQLTDSVCGARPIVTGTGPLRPAPGSGAAMCRSGGAARPRSVSQSLVQGGWWLTTTVAT